MSELNNSPLAVVRKKAVDSCYEGILNITSNFENMQIHYRKFNDPNWQKAITCLENAMVALHEISQSKLD